MDDELVLVLDADNEDDDDAVNEDDDDADNEDDDDSDNEDDDDADNEDDGIGRGVLVDLFICSGKG